MRPLFFPGLHQPNDARHFNRCMISINRLENRRSDFIVRDWILDSGAFTRITTGKGHMPVQEYAAHINRWKCCGNLLAAVSQDYMCEPFVLNKTGLTIRDHQTLTIERYLQLQAATAVTVMPVLQGSAPEDYVDHIRQYGNHIEPGMLVGLGSVCKRNASPWEIRDILSGIKRIRPDLRLHGFGIKYKSLGYQSISDQFYSTDSMAWSFAARKAGNNSNEFRYALEYARKVTTIAIQSEMFNA